MGRALPIAAAVLIVIAAGVWLMWPVEKVRPAPGSPAAADPVTTPALATAGGRSAAGDAIPAGGAALERAAGAGAPGTGSDEARGGSDPGKDAAVAGAKSRPVADGGAGGEPAAGDAPAEKKKDLWQGNLSLRGRILDTAGKPIAGAKVRLNDAWPWPGAPPRPFVQTDAEGRFEYGELPSNHYQVFVDTGSGEQPVAWFLLPGQEPFDLTLKPGTEKKEERPPGGIAVRVVGPDGKPVPRANVKVTGGKWAFGGFVDVVDGTFMRGPPEGAPPSYEIFGAQTKDGTTLPIGPATWTPKAGEEDLVTLPQGKAISGTVVGPDGKGVFGAEVAAYPVPSVAERGNAGSPIAVGKTLSDASGAFHILNLGEGPYRLQAMPLPPHLPSELVQSTVAVASLTLRVPAGLEADVTVLDGDGEPVAGAVVNTVAPVRAGRGAGTQVTDAAGRTHLSQLAPGVAYALQVSPPTPRKDLSTFLQKAWEPKDTTVRMPRAWNLKGVVRRADGAAKSSSVHRRGANGAWMIVAVTKNDGSFELKFAEPGPWVLAASASFDTPRGTEVTITDPAVAAELNAPTAATTAPTK